MKSESGFSLAIASQPLKRLHLLNNILALGKGLADQRVRNVLPLVFLQQVQTFSLFANTVTL